VADQNIVPFDFEGNSIRVISRATLPWWVLADVCRVLEIGNARDAASRLDDDEKDGVGITDAIGREQLTTVINESGLYSLILTSRKPAAKRFKKWVTAEVLPAIRQTGGYMVAAPDETPEALALRALTVLQATVERQKLLLAHATPKAEGFDRIANADGLFNLNAAAKTLGEPPQAFNRKLHAMGWIYKREPSSNWIGYQDKVKAGYLAHKSASVTRADGTTKEVAQVFLTPKGLTRLATAEGMH
jgi:prophage antirepressor-like protein